MTPPETTDGRFPQRRLVPVGLAVACFLVLCTAQRGILYSLVRREAGASSEDGWLALVLGTRSDLAVAALAFLPILLWATFLPHRAWVSRAHRWFSGAMLVLGLAAFIALLSIEGVYFVQSWTRFGPGAELQIRTLGRDFVAREDGRLALVAAASCLVVALVLVGLLRPLLERGFLTRVAVSARGRDLLLVVALGVLAVATTYPRPVAFPDRRALQELSGNGLVPLGRIALRKWSEHRAR